MHSFGPTAAARSATAQVGALCGVVLLDQARAPRLCKAVVLDIEKGFATLAAAGAQIDDHREWRLDNTTFDEEDLTVSYTTNTLKGPVSSGGAYPTNSWEQQGDDAGWTGHMTCPECEFDALD